MFLRHHGVRSHECNGGRGAARTILACGVSFVSTIRDRDPQCRELAASYAPPECSTSRDAHRVVRGHLGPSRYPAGRARFVKVTCALSRLPRARDVDVDDFRRAGDDVSPGPMVVVADRPRS